MRYWDASAIVPLLVRQARTDAARRLLDKDDQIVTWWGTSIECYSALMRLVREGHLTEASANAAGQRLSTLRLAWNEVLPAEPVRKTAERILRLHPLRAADAVQLAAALIAAEGEPDRLELVCFDERLADAARKEGFVPQPFTT